MKKTAAAIVFLLGCAAVAWAAAPAPIATLRAFRTLTNAEAAKGLPVALEGTVTYYAKTDVDLFLQDGDLAVYAQTQKGLKIAPGDRVLVRGVSRAGFRPDVVASEVVFLSHGKLPEAPSVSYLQLIRSEFDCKRVSVRAQVRSANLVEYGTVSSIYLELLMDGGYIDATIDGSDSRLLKRLLDSQVEITGAVAGKFDSKSQLTGIVLEVPDLSDVTILKSPASSIDSLPVTPMDKILEGYSVQDRSQRIRVHGVITYSQPGSAAVLQDRGKSLWISTLNEQPLRIGDLADATGFPDARDGSLALTHAEVEDSGVAAPVRPEPVTWTELASGVNAFDLVAVEGKVVMAVRQADRDEYVMVADGRLFSAIFRHPEEMPGDRLPPMKPVPQGAKVRITGVSMVYYGSDPFVGPVAFDILLRSPDDIEVISGPSLLSVPNLVFTVVFLLLIVGAAGVRGWTLERQVRRQTVAIAARTDFEARLERRRSRILEDINGSRPLAEILEEIAEMGSLTLNGAPCWCEIVDGARLGRQPDPIDGLRVVQEEIPGRCGTALGTFFAAFDSQTRARADELEALAIAARLATLAIETRRLYSDLVRRSEFDLLTDVHNRFSLDRQLEACIGGARETAGNFALIYVDLDEFKKVNDHFGHRVGDLYLQEVAVRMKRQLRGGDMLARLGGDEFAALLPMIASRAQADEIALRLERSFDEPFAVDGYTLRGSASVGVALYPEDGTTRDSLLSAADAAMYVTKHTRDRDAEELALEPDSGME
ncbi:MAG TPA: GGDEF domain-containing protein [Terracidiphilus sp.]|nr:GGDEF domain-containing protein [Terracidiphilus sp.]